MKFLVPVLVAVLFMGMPISADTNRQLVSSIENRLAQYGIAADVSQFAPSTVVQLHFALSSRQGYMKTKRELRSILRNAVYK